MVEPRPRPTLLILRIAKLQIRCYNKGYETKQSEVIIMSRIKGVKRLTENRFLNLYELDARQRDGKAITYYVASRAKGT